LTPRLHPGSASLPASERVQNVHDDSASKRGYRHYKGGEYTVIGVARHSETDEQLVVYRPEYGERGLWVRPLDMFCEIVEIDGKPTPRFEWIGSLEEHSRP